MTEQKKRKKKAHPMLLTAKLISSIFHPVYYPLVSLTLLFFCTFLEYAGIPHIIFTLCVTALFTIFLPTLLTYVYRMLFSISPQRFLLRHERFIPYTLHLVCYFVLLHILHMVNAHGLVLDVIIVSILIQACCTLINCFWKISMHAAGAGAVLGFLTAHGALFRSFSPILPIIISIIICGLVGTSRLILRRHTLSQVNVGTLMGILCGIAGTLLSSFRGFF